MKLATMVDSGHADEAVSLHEIFSSGCCEKAEQCDNSSGYLGMFLHDLFCGWVNARQTAASPASETIQQILKWKENDNYGFCYDMEKDLAEVLDRDGYRLQVDRTRKSSPLQCTVFPSQE